MRRENEAPSSLLHAVATDCHCSKGKTADTVDLKLIPAHHHEVVMVPFPVQRQGQAQAAINSGEAAKDWMINLSQLHGKREISWLLDIKRGNSKQYLADTKVVI